MTQKAVADYLHISPQSISKWENGEATPSIEHLPLLAELFGCRIDDFFKRESHTAITLTALESFAGYYSIFDKEKDDPDYVDPATYMKNNHGWENECLDFFSAMKNEKCFTVSTLQNYAKCDYETAQEICSLLESIGCLTKAPDSKYYVTNAENMGGFINMIKFAKVFKNVDRFKGKTNKEIDEIIENL